MHLYSLSTHSISGEINKFMVCGIKTIVKNNKYIVCFFNYGIIAYKTIENVT